MPPEVTMGRPVSTDARKWPTADQIQQALADWHDAMANVRAKWGAAPEQDRASLKPPPEPI